MNLEELSKPLDRKNVKQRRQGGAQVSYIEGWHAIAEANRIFGFDAWSRETVDLRCVCERERLIGQQQKAGWGVTYIAKVRVTVLDGDTDSGWILVREGVGSGHGIATDLGEAHESAIKEAETDAMKRALMTFGNPFGLALYDKDQREVTDGRQEAQKTSGNATIVTNMKKAINDARSIPVIDGVVTSKNYKADFAKLNEDEQAEVVKAESDKRAALSQNTSQAA